MQLLRFIPIRLITFLIGGILAAHFTNPPPEYPFLLAGLSLLPLALKLCGLLRIPAMAHALLIGLATFWLGTLCYVIAQPVNQHNHYLRYDINGSHLLYFKIREVWKPTAYASRYVAILEQVDCLKVKGNVLLNITPLSPRTYKVDEMLLIKGTLSEIKQGPNPFQFNYKQYLENLGIQRQLTADSTQILVGHFLKATFYGKAAGIRNRVVTRLEQAGMGKEALAIVNALLLGQRTELSQDTFTAFRDAGAIHILAVSGLHIGILLLMLNFLLRPLNRLPGGRAITLCSLILLLWGYALLAGFTASIVRAVSMFSFVAYALYLNRPANSFNILALSMFFILLAINPRLLFQVGFQMSYAAVFAIVWFLPLIQKLWVPRIWLTKKIWQLLSVSLAAQIGVLPVSLYYFHQFPGLFFLTNLLIIPMLGLLLGFGFFVAAMAYTGLLPQVMARGYEILISLMTGLVSLIAEQEAFILKDIPFALSELLLLYLLIVLVAQVLTKTTAQRVMMFLLSVILFQIWSGWLAYSSNRAENVWILHRARSTVLFHQTGDSLHAYSKSGTVDEILISGFKVGTRCRQLSSAPLKQAYRWRASNLVVMDENSAWPAPDGRRLYLLMTDSPKFHMGRMLDSLRPAMVIADGSNYPSYAALWKTSCKSRNISFHYTGTDGAYLLPITGN